MKNITILLCLILLISGKSYSQNENPFYKGSFKSAITKAKQDNKFILIDFHTAWCGGCKAYEKFVFSKPEIQTYIKNMFVALSIDAEKDEGIELTKKYEISSYPQIVIAYSDGKEIDRISGYDPKYSESPQEFIKKMNGIIDGTATLIKLENEVRDNSNDMQLKEKLILEYLQRDQYAKIPKYAKELTLSNDSIIREKGQFYYCYALIKDREIENPDSMISLLNKKTSLIKEYISAGYAALLNYYKRKYDKGNIDFYYQKVIAADTSDWYYKKKYALFLFENNMDIPKAHKIALDYYNAPVTDHYQPLLMAYSYAHQNRIEKGMEIFDEYMNKVKDLSMDDKQWAYNYYADFANKHNVCLEKALKYAKDLSDYRGQDIEINILLANLLAKNNQHKNAVDLLKNCLNYVQAANHYTEINNLIKQYESK
jgi:thioredoxin-related protein